MRSRSKVLPVACSLAAIAGVWILYVFDPSVTPFYPRCAFHALTGWQCPGCGMTRGLYQLLHGHIREAFRFNAMLFVFGPFLVAATARPQWLERPWVGWAAATLLIAWGIVRNLLHLWS
jgi:uncharacterized protein DUF2752